MLSLAVLGLIWLLFFSKIIFLGHFYFLDDLKIIYYPLEYAYAQFQQAGQLPLWSHYFGFGHPVLSWGQLGFFVPLHVVLRLLAIPPLTLLQISVVVHIGAGLLGMFCFLRRHRLSLGAAVLGATIFALSGFSVGHLNHVNFYTATMLAPWLWLAIDVWWARPTPRTTALVSLLGALIALSGQPQVVAYTFILAALYLLAVGFTDTHVGTSRLRSLARRAGWAVVAGIVALALASFALLPLQEFLPLTERNSGLEPAELYEFSYPPTHAITLLLPYFFGDHEHYWGAKGFQELAAYVGIIPLLLGGTALAAWSTHRPLRVFGSVALVAGIVFALGKHSPLYVYLVEHRWLTSLAVPGRFVYFFDVGVALLAALGLDDVAHASSSLSRRRRLVACAAALLFVVTLLTPFALELSANDRSREQFLSLLEHQPVEAWLVIVGGSVGIAYFFTSSWPRTHRAVSTLAVAITAGTLIVYGLNYNPTLPRAVAQQPAAFGEALRAFETEAGIPARLFSTIRPLIAPAALPSQDTTGPLSPELSVHQVIPIASPVHCLTFGYDVADPDNSPFKVAIRPALSAAPWRETTLEAFELDSNNRHQVCFTPIETTATHVVVSFTSDQATEVRLPYNPLVTREEPAYVVRGINQEAAPVEQSRQPIRIVVAQSEPPTEDREAAYIARHMQALYHASSARWIGALSIRPYREFIEMFFANDREEVYDGDGLHALARNRQLVDMVGITHVIQPITGIADYTALGFDLVQEALIGEEKMGLYRNRHAYPKAWLVPHAEFKPAPDETRHAMMLSSFNPRQLVYINGPKPPEHFGTDNLAAQGIVTLRRYEPTLVEARVETTEPMWIVVTDSTTPQWHTYVDGALQPHYVANTLFKTAFVPAGTHTVSFLYRSPAVTRATYLTLAAALIIFLGLMWPQRAGDRADHTRP